MDDFQTVEEGESLYPGEFEGDLLISTVLLYPTFIFYEESGFARRQGRR